MDSKPADSCRSDPAVLGKDKFPQVTQSREPLAHVIGHPVARQGQVDDLRARSGYRGDASRCRLLGPKIQVDQPGRFAEVNETSVGYAGPRPKTEFLEHRKT